MMFNTRYGYNVAYLEACNVLSGRTVDDTADIPLRIPFSKDPAVRRAAGRLVMSIGYNCDVTFYGDLEDRTALYAKVLAHLVKTGVQSLEAIARFKDKDLIAHAIRHNRHLLREPVNISGILRIHKQREAEQAHASFESYMADAPPRAELWRSDDGRYQLQELTDPRHLVHESDHIGHCTGKEFCNGVPKNINMRPNNQEALFYLAYWQVIKRGRNRVFSLAENGIPVASLDYVVAPKELVQICPATPPVTVEEPYFTALCGALQALRSHIPLLKIADLPKPPPGNVLTARGTFEPPSMANITCALAAPETIILPATATMDVVATYASSPLVTLDLTLTPQETRDAIRHAPARLVFSDAEKVSLPNLETVGEILAKAATSVHLPNLTTGNVACDAATTAALSLHVTGDIRLASVPHLELPAHRDGHIHAARATTLYAPEHRRGWVDAVSVLEVDLPNLRDHACVDVRNALSVNLPLQDLGSIYASSATSFHAPKHRFGSVDAGSVQHIDMPDFVEGSLLAFNALTIKVPKHRRGEIIARAGTVVERQHGASGEVLIVSPLPRTEPDSGSG